MANKFRRGPIPRRGRIEPRLLQDSHSFQVEEKFDTWLDLAPLQKLQSSCSNFSSWGDVPKELKNPVLSMEGIGELEYLNIAPNDLVGYRVDPRVVTILIKRILTGSGYQTSYPIAAFRAHVKSTLSAACIATHAQYDHLTSHVGPNLLPFTQPGMQKLSEKHTEIPPLLLRIWAVSEDFMRVLRHYKELHTYSSLKDRAERVKERMHKIVSTMKIPSIRATITITRDLILLKCPAGRYILTKDQFLEVHNKISELWCVMLYSHFLSGSTFPSNDFDVTYKFILHLADMVLLHHHKRSKDLSHMNMGFTYLKSIEGLVVAELIRRGDEPLGWVNDTLGPHLWQALVDAEVVPPSSWADSDLLKIFRECSSAQMAELAGLVKILGHPSIEVEVGLQKLYDRTHAHLAIDEEAVKRSRSILKRDICHNYYLREKRFPQVVFSERCDPLLRRSIIQNHHPSSPAGSLVFKNMDLLAWDEIEFGKNDLFDPIDKQFTILKDKALGLTRTKIWKILVGSLSKHKEANLLSIENRRALLAFILNPDFDSETKEYLSDFANDPDLETMVWEYLVIKLTPKELEEKPEGRMFGASPHPERNRRIIMDKNLTHFMRKYIPEQLLTPDELAMTRKMFSFRHFASMYPHHTLLQFSFDFSRWNNNFRRETVDHLMGPLMDGWFQTNMYKKIMLAFEKTLVYYKDKSFSRWWDGQLGGIEGLSQPAWSLSFLGGLKQALMRVGYLYRITIKGDDVRAAIAVPNDQLAQHGHDAIKQQILFELERLCNDMGWQLNPQETFCSLSLICTSKQYQMNDTWLSASKKKMQKCCSLSNLIYPTLEDVVSNVFSTAHSAVGQTTTCLMGFATAMVVASRELTRQYGEKLLPAHGFAAMLIWPQVLGGPGCLPLQTFFVRGENDMLSVSISLLRHIMLYGDDDLSRYTNNILRVATDERADTSLLVADPYAIPLRNPERPSAVLMREISEALRKTTKNPDLKTLFSKSASDDKDRLIEHLSSMRPYLAKVATVLYECSPHFLVAEVLAKFKNSSTVFRFLTTSGRGKRTNSVIAHKALSKVIRAAKARIKFWYLQLKSPSHWGDELLGVPSHVWESPKICTTEIAHRIRKALWGFAIEGITYPSLVDQNHLFHSRDLNLKTLVWPVSEVVTEIAILHKRAVFQTDLESHHYAAVPGLLPWIGSTTSTKTTMPKGTIDIHTPTLQKIEKLCIIRNLGTSLGQGFVRTAETLAKSLTTVNLRALRVFAPTIMQMKTGHRLPTSAYSLTVMPNYRPNLMQIVDINSEGTTRMRGVVDDYTINFAARHYFLVVLASWPLQFSMTLPPDYPDILYTVFHWDPSKATNDYQFCPWCCNRLVDQPVKFQVPCPTETMDYNTLPLVATTLYEETILKENIKIAVKGQAMSIAEGLFPNVNEDTREVSAYLMLNRALRASYDLMRSGLAENALGAPPPALAGLLALSSGLVTIHEVSLNTLRCISPNHLYSWLFWEALEFLCDIASHSASTGPEIIALIQRHRNPFRGIFNELQTAGLLNHLARGSLDSQVARKFHPQPITWAPSDSTSPHSASLTFLGSLYPVFRRWTLGEITLEKPIIVQGYPTQESVMDALRTKQNVTQRAWNALVSKGWRSLVMRIISLPYVLRHYPGLMDERVINTNFECLMDEEDCPLHFVDLMNDILELDDPNTVVVFHRLLLACVLAICPSLAIRACDLTVVQHLEWGKFTPRISLIELGDDFLTPKYSAALLENFPEIHTVVRLVGQGVVQWLMNTLYALNTLDEEVQVTWWHEIREGQLPLVLLRLKWLNEVRVAVYNSQDAEETLRQSKTLLQQEMLEQITEMDQVMEDWKDEPLNIIHGCNIRDHSGRVYEDIQIHSLPQHEDRARFWGLDWIPLDFQQLLQGDQAHHVDMVQSCHIVGHINSSPSRFILAFNACRARCLTVDDVDPGRAWTAACLGDGAGGLTHYMVTAYKCHVLYNTLFATPYHRQADAPLGSGPISLEGVGMSWDLKRRVHHDGQYPGDLTKPEVINAIGWKLNTLPPLELILCDMDIGNISDADRYYNALFNVMTLVRSHLSADGACYIKLRVMLKPVFVKIIVLFSMTFNHWHVYAPGIDRASNPTVILIGHQPRALPAQVYLHPPQKVDILSLNVVPHARLIEYLRETLAPIELDITNFRLGVPVVAPVLRRVIGTYCEWNAPAVTLQTMLLRGWSVALDNDTHWCRLELELCHHLEDSIDRLCTLVRVARTRRGAIKIGGGRKKSSAPVAAAGSTDKKIIMSIFNLLTARVACSENISSYFTNPGVALDDFIFQVHQSWEEMIFMIRQNQGQYYPGLMIARDEGKKTLVVRDNNHEYVTLRDSIVRAFNVVMKIGGIIMMSSTYMRRNPSLYRKFCLIQNMANGLVHDCCYQNLTEYYDLQHRAQLRSLTADFLNVAEANSSTSSESGPDQGPEEYHIDWNDMLLD